MAKKKKLITLPPSEWQVMRAVWSVDRPLKPMEVLALVEAETGWRLSTVRTILRHLAAKGALKEKMIGGTNFYSPLLFEEDLRVAEGERVIEQFFDGTLAGLMSCFIETGRVSTDELREIHDLIANEIEKKKS